MWDSQRLVVNRMLFGGKYEANDVSRSVQSLIHVAAAFMTNIRWFSGWLWSFTAVTLVTRNYSSD